MGVGIKMERKRSSREIKRDVDVCHHVLIGVAVRMAAGHAAVLGGELGASLEERLEDRVRLLEVVVYHVHEVVRIHDAVDELARRRFRLVELRPLTAELVSLVLKACISIYSKKAVCLHTFQAIKLIASTIVG